MRHQVRLVSDDQMPAGKPWLLCQAPQVATLFLSESVLTLGTDKTQAVLEEAWAGWTELQT